MSLQTAKLSPSQVAKPRFGSVSIFVNADDADNLWYKDAYGNVYPYFVVPEIPEVSIRANNVAYVSATYGDDNTAELGNRLKPFSTINQASYVLDAYMQSNFPFDTKTNRLVYIIADTYYQTVDLLPNMNYYCETGVVFISFGGVMFTKLSGTLGNTYWYGKAVFKEAEGMSAWNEMFEIRTGCQVYGIVYFEFDYFESAIAGLFFGDQSSDYGGKVIIRGRYVRSSGYVGIGSSYLVNPRRYMRLDMKLDEDYIAEDGGLLVFGGSSAINRVDVRVEARNWINRGNTSVSFGLGSTVWMQNNQAPTQGNKITIVGNLVNERGTSDTTLYVSQQQMWEDVEIDGDISSVNGVAVYFNTAQQVTASPFPSTTKIKGKVSSVNNKAVLFGSSQTIPNTNVLKIDGDVVSETNVAIDFPASGYLFLKLKNSHIKSAGAFYPISVPNANHALYLYNCLIESLETLSIYTNGLNPSVNSVGSYANKPVDAGVTDNWEGVNTTHSTIETF